MSDVEHQEETKEGNQATKENAQTTIFPAQQQEWQEAFSALMKYAKTPYYVSERTEI